MMSPQEHLEESINYALKTAKLNNGKNFFPKLNETEQGIFAWGLDFLEMQKKNLESMTKDLSGIAWMSKMNEVHIELQIQLLDKFIDLIKNKTVLTPWENDPKAQ